MNLSELLEKRLVEKVEPDSKRSKELIDAALRNISAAEDNLKTGHSADRRSDDGSDLEHRKLP